VDDDVEIEGEDISVLGGLLIFEAGGL